MSYPPVHSSSMQKIAVVPGEHERRSEAAGERLLSDIDAMPHRSCKLPFVSWLFCPCLSRWICMHRMLPEPVNLSTRDAEAYDTLDGSMSNPLRDLGQQSIRTAHSVEITTRLFPSAGHATGTSMNGLSPGPQMVRSGAPLSRAAPKSSDLMSVMEQPLIASRQASLLFQNVCIRPDAGTSQGTSQQLSEKRSSVANVNDTGGEPEAEDEDNEPKEDYVSGGYHPVTINDTYDNRYRVRRKLGWGVYSTVWQCTDMNMARNIALKIQKSAPEYSSAAMNEIKILQHVQKEEQAGESDSHVVKLIEHFYVVGPHGNHVCMVFELLGHTLLRKLQEYGTLPIRDVKCATTTILECLAFLHDRIGIIHTDIKPENVLLETNHSEFPGLFRRLKLVDLGTAFYINRQTARDIQTREYRCPEGILGIWPFEAAADIWSVGCLVFELLTGETLFDPQSPKPGELYTKDESHIAQAIELLGELPTDLVRQGAVSEVWFVDDKSTLRNIVVHPPPEGVDALAKVLEDNFYFQSQDSVAISHFLRHLLQYEPASRLSARHALALAW
eukprot:CAMPEP_0198657120 /NCGR_PEP_ID=MMETSP1467-20131203/11310_1 /TAXON_ID=1462469 /ORGANISM="unid. sp., Strain CCMP2135" /LENGTH=556 /DNA_ID=CAMNT_0044393213 /DNA_START=243 /DNA_END=1910 /DNA_ORIENTATION=-